MKGYRKFTVVVLGIVLGFVLALLGKLTGNFTTIVSVGITAYQVANAIVAHAPKS